MKKNRLISCKNLLSVALLVPGVSMAQLNHFNSGSVTTAGAMGDYDTATQWSHGTVPSGVDSPLIGGGRTALLSSSVADVSAFLIGSNLKATNGADVSANVFYVGRGGSAARIELSSGAKLE